MNKIQNKYRAFNVRFTLEYHQRTLKNCHKGYFRHVCYSVCYFSKTLVPEKHMKDIADIIFYLFHYSGSLLPQIIIHQLGIQIRQSMSAHPFFSQYFN